MWSQIKWNRQTIQREILEEREIVREDIEDLRERDETEERAIEQTEENIREDIEEVENYEKYDNLKKKMKCKRISLNLNDQKKIPA